MARSGDRGRPRRARLVRRDPRRAPARRRRGRAPPLRVVRAKPATLGLFGESRGRRLVGNHRRTSPGSDGLRSARDVRDVDKRRPRATRILAVPTQAFDHADAPVGGPAAAIAGPHFARRLHQGSARLMMTTLRCFATLALSCAATAIASRVLAQGADESARADRLFTEAMQLVGNGQYTEACPKLEASQQLDPALGTQYNLALCYEKIGRLGSAWRNLVAVEKLAHATGKTAREEAAQEKLKEWRPRTPHLVLRPSDPDATVKVDGETLDPAESSFYAVDPGGHAIDATAPARQPWHADVAVRDAEEVVVTVPKLHAAPVKVITVNTTNGTRTAAIVFGAVGAAGVVTGIVTGVLVLDAKSAADHDCTPVCADQSGRDAVSRGNTLIPINDVAWAVGGAGLGSAVVLYLISLSHSPSASGRTVLAPMAAAGVGGVSVLGSF